MTIPAGEASGSDTLTVTPTNDAVVEGDETIVVSGSVTGFSVDGRHHHAGPMTTRRSCRSVDRPASVAEGNNAAYTVTLSKEVAKLRSRVVWSMLRPERRSSGDYTATPSTLTFADGFAGWVRPWHVQRCAWLMMFCRRLRRRSRWRLGDGDLVICRIAGVGEVGCRVRLLRRLRSRTRSLFRCRVRPLWRRVTPPPTTRCRCRRRV